MRRWRMWTRRLAFGVLGLTLLAPVASRADGSDDPPRAHERVVKIGPQAVVIVNERGGVRMYDDPSQDERACKSRASCWGRALNMLGLFGLMTYLDLTEGVEGSGRVLERTGPIE